MGSVGKAVEQGISHRGQAPERGNISIPQHPAASPPGILSGLKVSHQSIDTFQSVFGFDVLLALKKFKRPRNSEMTQYMKNR